MWQTKLAEGGKNLVLTVWTDKTQLLTVEQASQLTLSEFGNLWRVILQTSLSLVILHKLCFCCVCPRVRCCDGLCAAGVRSKAGRLFARC